MAKSFVLSKKISNGLKGYFISRALVQSRSILGDGGTPQLKSVSVKESVSVKIGNFTKIGIGMLFLLEEKSVSVSVCYLLHRIAIGKVKSSKIG